MAIQQYPEPAGPTIAESYGMAFTANAYSNVAEADDNTTVNQTLIPLDSVKTITPGVYEAIGTQTGISRWSVRTATNPNVFQSINVGTANAVAKITTTGTLFANANTQWRRDQYIPIATSTGRLGEPVYADGYIVVPITAVDAGGNLTPYISVSTNGTSWTDYIPASAANSGVRPYSVNKVNSRWVVSLSSGYMSTSTDLINWTTGNSIGSSNFLNSIASNGTRLVGAPVDTASVLFTSTDAINWSTVASNATTRMRRVRYLNNFWFAMGNGGIVRSSTNGTSWNTVTAEFAATEAVTDGAYGNSAYILVSQFGNINFSTDGVNWTTAEQNIRYNNVDSRRFYLSLFNNGRFMVNGWHTTAGSNRLFTSTNGFNWSDITQANTVSSYANSNFAQGITVPSGDALNEYAWTMWAIDSLGAFESTANQTTARPMMSWSKTVKGAIATTLTSATLKQVAPLNVNYTTSI
jgi:hypothetical protein